MDFFELHQGLPREGPGDDASTERAFGAIASLPPQPAILDIGCGPGAQTLTLARLSDGPITAVDNHQPFLNHLRARAKLSGLGTRVVTVVASMEELPFADGAFDLIWSEAAIFIMGFERGIRAWRRFLKPHGYLVVSDLTWIAASPPGPALRYWTHAYPEMGTLEGNRAIIKQAKYSLITDFAIPKQSWFTQYFDPLEKRIDDLLHKYRNEPDNVRWLEAQRVEIDIVRKYGDSFAYVFYVMQRTD